MGRRSTPAALGYWTPENQSNEWRSLGNHSNSHGYGFPVDAGYTRLKDITLGYNFGQKTLSTLGIGGLQLYVSGRNLATWTDWLGWDPEARDITRGSSNDNINYPMVRTYVLGANLTF
ncbi:TonB-linked outer membrane protein, SusC/RagA family [compost metagenome]